MQPMRNREKEIIFTQEDSATPLKGASVSHFIFTAGDLYPQS